MTALRSQSSRLRAGSGAGRTGRWLHISNTHRGQRSHHHAPMSSSPSSSLPPLRLRFFPPSSFFPATSRGAESTQSQPRFSRRRRQRTLGNKHSSGTFLRVRPHPFSACLRCPTAPARPQAQTHRQTRPVGAERNTRTSGLRQRPARAAAAYGPRQPQRRNRGRAAVVTAPLSSHARQRRLRAAPPAAPRCSFPASQPSPRPYRRSRS